jgi:WD40 repeat protein
MMSKNNWSEITTALSRFNKSFLIQVDALTEQFNELSEAQKSSEMKDNLAIFLNQLKGTFNDGLNEIMQSIENTHFHEYELVLDRRGSREILADALDKTQKSLIIVCPWLTAWGVTEHELEKFKELLEKGVSISIGWGRAADLKSPKKLNSLWYSALPQLFELERIYPLTFNLKAIGTHEKFLVCDEEFAVLGSHNILTSSKEIGDREIGIFTNSHQIIEDLINRFEEACEIEIKPITKISIDKKTSESKISIVADECGVSENDINSFINELFELEHDETDEFLNDPINSPIIDHFIEEAEKYPSEEDGDTDIFYLEPEHELLSSQEKSIHCVKFNPYGDTLATCGYEQGIEIWDTTTGKLNQTLGEPSQSVSSIEFDRYGERLVSSSKNTINIWDLKSQTLASSINARLREVTSFALSPNGEVVAAAGHGNVKLWNLNTG